MDTEEVKKSALRAVQDATSSEALAEIRLHYLGRKGEVTRLLRSLGEMSLAERRRHGPAIQSLKRELEALIEKKNKEIGDAGEDAPPMDLTVPGRKKNIGHAHPLTRVEEEVRHIFRGMNFSVVNGPEVETEYYNFDALNIPPDHPARDMWDTFWLRQDEAKKQKAKSKNSGRLLLRTHTSPVQIRYMESHEPPFQIIVPGRAFRYEATDMSHETNFYQVEGLMVGKEVSLAHFKFVVETFFQRFFAGKKIEFRYRPSYFPFVEPGVEVDVKMGNKWLEMMGAGMVHPHVFEAAHYNPRDWQGFAFGVGLDRLAMVKYDIPDIRLFYSGDLRFIRQF